MVNYHYVYHRETDEQAFRLQEGEFEGVVWNYTNVRLPIDDEDGNRLDLEEVESIPLTFQYDLLYNKDGVVNDESKERFAEVIGDVLLNAIDEGIEHDKVEIGNDNSEQFDS